MTRAAIEGVETVATKKTNADTSFETYTYDLSGRLQTEVDAMGRTTTCAYTVGGQRDCVIRSTPISVHPYSGAAGSDQVLRLGR